MNNLVSIEVIESPIDVTIEDANDIIIEFTAGLTAPSPVTSNQKFIMAGGETSIILAQAPVDPLGVPIFLNGIPQEDDQYTITGKVVNFVFQFQEGDRVFIPPYQH